MLNQLPELPQNVNVQIYNSGVKDDWKWVVDHKQLESDPKSLLLYLGIKYLLKERAIPNINYKESPGVDAGGLRRYFITQLCKHIFADGEEDNKRLPMEDGYPVSRYEKHASFLFDKEDEACYKTLGRIFALCYPETSQYKTGPIMGRPEIYTWITQLATPSSPSDEWYLSTYLECIKDRIKINKNIVLDLMDIDKPLPELSNENLQMLSYYVDPTAETQIDSEYFADAKNRKLLREEFLTLAKRDKTLGAVRFIAAGMYDNIKKKGWAELCAAGGAALRKGIEGAEITLEDLLSKMEWTGPKDQRENTKNFLENWLAKDLETNPKKLENFVVAVTSLRALSSQKLKMLLDTTKSKDHLPVAHTCFFRLDIPSSYPTEEHLFEKMDKFLNLCLAGSGFELE